jgi:hypothetical protein
MAATVERYLRWGESKQARVRRLPTVEPATPRFAARKSPEDAGVRVDDWLRRTRRARKPCGADLFHCIHWDLAADGFSNLDKIEGVSELVM